MLKRIAIILEKNLERGQVGNVAAILMGQASVCCPDIYDPEPILDQEENRHAAICYSTVILKAGQSQIVNFVSKVRTLHPNITCILFSQAGQKLHNRFEEYRSEIASHTTKELLPVGVLITGDDEEVRSITRGFSLLT